MRIIVNIIVHVIIGLKEVMVYIKVGFFKVGNAISSLNKPNINLLLVGYSLDTCTPRSNYHGATFTAQWTKKRSYSTTSCLRKPLTGISKSEDFWRQVNTRKVNELNPHYVANKFLQDYPSQELAKKNLTYDLITRIMRSHITNFSMSLSEFNILNNIKPIRLSFPFNLSLPEVAGKPLRGGTGTAGVYLFTNKINHERYIGSSINLALRLKHGYFGKLPLIGQRKIERAIREYGLGNFYLDVFLLPKELTSNSESSASIKETLRFLVLGLEQMLIMLLNPELNEIKVAGSSPGALTSKGLRNSYLYDGVNKQLVYVVNGRKNLAEILGCHENGIKRYLIQKDNLYLKRFFVADDILSDSDYTNNLMSLSGLKYCLNKIRLDRKNYLTKVVPSREETNLKLRKR